MSYRRRGGAAIVVAGAVAILFGLATIFSGTQALFGDEAAQKAVGDAVAFVLWFNFGAGFVYVMAGGGLLLRRKWAVGLSTLIAAATGLVVPGLRHPCSVRRRLRVTHRRRDVAAHSGLDRHCRHSDPRRPPPPPLGIRRIGWRPSDKDVTRKVKSGAGPSRRPLDARSKVRRKSGRPPARRIIGGLFPRKGPNPSPPRQLGGLSIVT